MEDKIGIEIPNPKTDYHGHPEYTKVYLRLLLLFGTSLLSAYLFPIGIAIGIIFFVAVIQASLVLKNFMHIKYEPVLIWIIAIAVIFTLFAFFFGVYIDITTVPRELAK